MNNIFQLLNTIPKRINIDNWMSKANQLYLKNSTNNKEIKELEDNIIKFKNIIEKSIPLNLECDKKNSLENINYINITVDHINNKILKENKEKNNKYHIETRIKLKRVLDRSYSTKIHRKTIMKLPSLKDAHIYCKINNLSGQISGPMLEKYIAIKYSMIKNNASFCNGDLNNNKINIEIKTSNGGKENNKFNYVQLRINHSCEYILTAYYIDYANLDNLGELYIFKLNKENIKQLILKYGNYAHGTIKKLGKITIEDLNNINNSKEYALRPKYGDKCWIELLNFRINQIII
jgi:hypothetical protein